MESMEANELMETFFSRVFRNPTRFVHAFPLPSPLSFLLSFFFSISLTPTPFLSGVLCACVRVYLSFPSRPTYIYLSSSSDNHRLPVSLPAWEDRIAWKKCVFFLSQLVFVWMCRCTRTRSFVLSFFLDPSLQSACLFELFHGCPTRNTHANIIKKILNRWHNDGGIIAREVWSQSVCKDTHECSQQLHPQTSPASHLSSASTNLKRLLPSF